MPGETEQKKAKEKNKLIFADLFFLYFFLPVCLVCYFATKKLKYRNLILVAFSLIFYAWGEPLWVLLLLFSSMVNWLLGIAISPNREKTSGKILLAVALIYNIGMLGMFKYSGFIAENINALAGTHLSEDGLGVIIVQKLNAAFDIGIKESVLPIGISFYTFQILSYIIDVYWGKVQAQKSFYKFLMYVSLFPQLVAGPIVRYADIEAEIEDRKTKLVDLSEGFSRLVIGVSKKVIIANNLSSVVTTMFGDSDNGYAGLKSVSAVGTWYGIIVIALWYYFDFSGYSDIAIGLGRMFGFHFNENFNYPYISKNITEFWQRWHISLGSFFRDYLLYMPIFGKRRKYGGLFLVWFCTGLWHGASWNFILWGLYYGLFIVLELKIGRKRMKKMPSVLAHIYVTIVVAVGYGIFYFEDLPSLGRFFKSLVGLNGNGIIDAVTRTSVLNNLFLLIAAILLSTPVVQKIKKLGDKSVGACITVNTVGMILNVVLLIVSSLFLLSTTNNPFLYFRF